MASQSRAFQLLCPAAASLVLAPRTCSGCRLLQVRGIVCVCVWCGVWWPWCCVCGVVCGVVWLVWLHVFIASQWSCFRPCSPTDLRALPLARRQHRSVVHVCHVGVHACKHFPRPHNTAQLIFLAALCSLSRTLPTCDAGMQHPTPLTLLSVFGLLLSGAFH